MPILPVMKTSLDWDVSIMKKEDAINNFMEMCNTTNLVKIQRALCLTDQDRVIKYLLTEHSDTTETGMSDVRCMVVTFKRWFLKTKGPFKLLVLGCGKSALVLFTYCARNYLTVL